MHYIKFQYYYFKWILYGYLGKFLVNLYIKFTPDKPVDDSLRAMLLEQILFYHRRKEVDRYNTWVKVCKYAAFMGVEEEKILSTLSVAELDTEDSLVKDLKS